MPPTIAQSRHNIKNYPDDALEASDAASCFLGLVEEKLEKQPEFILPIMPELLPAVRYVGENQASFDADESIYGKFQEKGERIEALYARLED